MTYWEQVWGCPKAATHELPSEAAVSGLLFVHIPQGRMLILTKLRSWWDWDLNIRHKPSCTDIIMFVWLPAAWENAEAYSTYVWQAQQFTRGLSPLCSRMLRYQRGYLVLGCFRGKILKHSALQENHLESHHWLLDTISASHELAGTARALSRGYRILKVGAYEQGHAGRQEQGHR